MTSTKNNICCIFNYAPHYREPVYQAMAEKLRCDFYFGDDPGTKGIKELPLEELVGFQRKQQTKRILGNRFYWQKGAWRLLFKPYSVYIITGSPFYLSNWVIGCLGKLLNKPVYAWTHGIKHQHQGNKKRLKFEQRFYRLFDKILLYGNFSKETMLKLGFPANQLVTIYNSLDHQAHKQLRLSISSSQLLKDHFGNDNPVVIYIGRIQKSKKLEQIVQAQALLKQRGRAFNFVVLGPKTEGEFLEQEVKKYGLENETWFYGPCYEEATIAEFLINAQVCVSPGPIGLTAIHAASFGLPIVTNDLLQQQMPEFEVIVENQTGGFFKNDDIEALAESIEKWAFLGPEERKSCREMAIGRVDQYYNPDFQVSLLQTLISPR